MHCKLNIYKSERVSNLYDNKGSSRLAYWVFFCLFWGSGIFFRRLSSIFRYCIWITLCILHSFSSMWSWNFSYNTGTDRLRRTPAEVTKWYNQFCAWKILWKHDNKISRELTNIDKSKKVEDTTNVRYHPQQKSNLTVKPPHKKEALQIIFSID